MRCMSSEAPPPERVDHDETLALKRLLYFQFFMLTGLLAFGLPGSLALEGAPIGDFLTGIYGAALCMHAFFLWRLWVIEPRFRGYYLAVLAIVVLVPWIAWAAKRYADMHAGLVGAAAFVIIAITAFITLGRKRTPA